jgi:hypothetical protein
MYNIKTTLRNMDSDKWIQMSLDNAKLAIEQYNTITKMETKDDIIGYENWGDYITNHSTKYQSLIGEIEKCIQQTKYYGGFNFGMDSDDLVKGIANTTKLTDEKKKGIQTLLGWVKKDNLYKIGNRTKEGTTIIDQLKKIILLEQYDSMDKELLNGLRDIYVNNPIGRLRK